MHVLRPLAFLALTSLPLAGQALLGVDFNFGDVWRVTPTGMQTRLASNPTMQHNAMALDSTGTYWSAAKIGGYFGLTQIDPALGTATVVFAPTSEFRGLAAHGTGLLGIRLALADTELVRIDTTTGAETLIGSTGMTSLTALTMHNGTCYAWQVTLGLVTLSLQTGVATDVDPTNGNPVGFGSAAVQFLTSLPDGRLIGGRTFVFHINAANGAATPLGPSMAVDLRGAELLGTGGASRSPRVCAGAFGPLVLSVSNFTSALTTVSGPHTGSVPGFALIGLSRTSFAGGPLPVWLGVIGPTNCLLNVSPDIVVPGTANSSGTALSISVPLPPSISRVLVYVQHLALEPVVGGMATTASLPVLLRP